MASVFKPGRPGASAVGGFTLIELLVTLAVLAVVLGLAVPSFQGIIQQNRLAAATNELVAAAQRARAEANRRNRQVALCPVLHGSTRGGHDWTRAESIRRYRQVVLCPTLNGSTCSGSDWTRTVVRVPSNNDVVREFRITGAGISAIGSANVASNSQITFSPNGLVRVGSGSDTS